MLCAIVLGLVVGFKNWDMLEFTAMAGSPVVIYLVRTAISTYYGYRIDTVTRRLEEQQTERSKTIEKLKAATKYNSTQQLLEKYGGATPKPKRMPSEKSIKKAQQSMPERTGLPPPPTAYIPSKQPQPAPRISVVPQGGPQQAQLQERLSLPSTPAQHPGADFAPNAYPAAQQYLSGGSVGGHHWYDRFLDVLLGEDEAAPRNRIVLICQNCRLVNGQTPPGVKSLTELGKWRCSACGMMNGEDDEGKKLVEEMKEKLKADAEPDSSGRSEGDEADTSDETSGLALDAEESEEAELDSQEAIRNKGEETPKTRKARPKRSTK